ncbi:YjbQ family protein [Halomonas koreensis]|uniref:YjbQ family protein n=1 Tax=Halomonas koreensis TaxID=245385 RepID=A0ABU1G063_9GAMM|nr:YjbQ family protein [Halomonas koreensis]MDR5866259.1 YjbQ family protein [Halomonas koreensis]
MDRSQLAKSIRQDIDVDIQKICFPSNHGRYRRPYGVHLSRMRDMPAHVAASLLGTQLTLAVRDGRLALGTWQGIWLGEHRDRGGGRRMIATLNGQ